MPTIKLKGADYIYERITADGRLTSYQVKIRRKGFPVHNTSFDDLEAAKAFVRQVLHDQDKGTGSIASPVTGNRSAKSSTTQSTISYRDAARWRAPATSFAGCVHSGVASHGGAPRPCPT